MALYKRRHGTFSDLSSFLKRRYTLFIGINRKLTIEHVAFRTGPQRALAKLSLTLLALRLAARLEGLVEKRWAPARPPARLAARHSRPEGPRRPDAGRHPRKPYEPRPRPGPGPRDADGRRRPLGKPKTNGEVRTEVVRPAFPRPLLTCLRTVATAAIGGVDARQA